MSVYLNFEFKTSSIYIHQDIYFLISWRTVSSRDSFHLLEDFKHCLKKSAFISSDYSEVFILTKLSR